ncbi:MAG: hypothetical protein WDW38_009501 [Sanguina aurantia]
MQPQPTRQVIASAAPSTSYPTTVASPSQETTYIVTSVTASTVAEFLLEVQEAAASGVDIIELRLDFLTDFNPERDLDTILAASPLPFIVTYRPTWEGGNYSGPEPQRLAALKYAALRGAPYVDVEFKAAQLFFADAYEVPLSTKVILSYHDFKATPEAATLAVLAEKMRVAGADIVKIAAMANNVTDAARMLRLLEARSGPMIALSMGEKGSITRLLAGKYGGYLTFAALSPDRSSAPGQPTIAQLRGLYALGRQGPGTMLFGILGNPVSHSRSPLIHNTAFQHIGFDAVYVPLLVDDLPSFLDAFQTDDFAGFSVTIPHKEAALAAASIAHPLAAQIGAANTLIRLPTPEPSPSSDGSSSNSSSSSSSGTKPQWKAYNTDCSAAISAIERGLVAAAGKAGGGGSSSGSGGSGKGQASPLQGKMVVVIGAGGAGKALALGAVSKGATVLIANRGFERAQALAASIGPAARAVPWESLQSGEVSGDVLANSTSVGMAPLDGISPVPASVTAKFSVVFDAVYTPLWTRLLCDAGTAVRRWWTAFRCLLVRLSTSSSCSRDSRLQLS